MLPVARFMLGLMLLITGAGGALSSHAQFVSSINRESAKNSIANYRLHGVFSLGQILRVRTNEGLLSAELVADFPLNEAVRVEIEGSDATWVVRNRNLGSAYLTITRYDFDAAPDEMWSVSITMRNNYFAIYAQTGDGVSGIRARLTQSNKTLRLSITQSDGGLQKSIISATAESIQQLQAEQPDALRKYIAPALRLISGHYLFRPGPTDVYRLFPEIPSNPKAVRELETLLLKLDAPDYAEREAASRALAGASKPVILAAVRRSKNDLSEEAHNRLDTFLAAQTSLSLDDIGASRSDPYLLLDCCEDEDPAVRTAAHARLSELLRAKIDFDPSAAPAVRAKSIEAMRAQVERFVRAKNPPVVSPATQPATPVRPKVWIE